MATRPEVTGRKTGRRLLDYRALKDRGIPWTRIHIGRLEAAGKFPLHIDVGEQLDAWFEDEVDDFLEMKAAERDAKAAEVTRRRVPRSPIPNVSRSTARKITPPGAGHPRRVPNAAPPREYHHEKGNGSGSDQLPVPDL